MKAIRIKLEAERSAHQKTKDALQRAFDVLGAIEDMTLSAEPVSKAALTQALKGV